MFIANIFNVLNWVSHKEVDNRPLQGDNQLVLITAGSTFWHPGLFDVKKTDDLPEEERDSSGCPLTVRVGSDLDDFSRVRVKITDLTEQEEDMDIDDVSHASIGKKYLERDF